MSLWSEMSDDADEFLETFGRPITFRGASLYAMISRAPVEQILSDGGLVNLSGYQVRIHAPAGSIYAVTPPTQGEHMTVFGRRHTVTSVTYRPPAPWVDVMVSDSTSA